MKMKVFLVVTVALILLYAIHLGRDVKLSVKLPGTGASLEVTDQRTKQLTTLSQGHIADDNDVVAVSPRAE